jgi:hypothetical protein
MEFIPEQPGGEAQAVPFFDDVTSEGGWQGHSTGKSLDTLKSEVMVSMNRLGGLVSGFQKGVFQTLPVSRDGFRIHYVVERLDGGMMRGRLDIAALPVRTTRRAQKSLTSYREKSLKMALYMLRNALDGSWFLQQLSPGFAPLLPWMIEERTGKTITQLWTESSALRALMPPEGEFIEGEFLEVKE